MIHLSELPSIAQRADEAVRKFFPHFRFNQHSIDRRLFEGNGDGITRTPIQCLQWNLQIEGREWLPPFYIVSKESVTILSDYLNENLTECEVLLNTRRSQDTTNRRQYITLRFHYSEDFVEMCDQAAREEISRLLREENEGGTSSAKYRCGQRVYNSRTQGTFKYYFMYTYRKVCGASRLLRVSNKEKMTPVSSSSITDIPPFFWKGEDWKWLHLNVSSDKWPYPSYQAFQKETAHA